MNELIKIEEKNGIETVNARDLYDFLESKRQFANWIKSKIEKYNFIENQDFTLNKIVIGKTTQIDYYLSIEMAKELSMVENNEKGKQARQYFIECEKKFNNKNDNQLTDKRIDRLENLVENLIKSIPLIVSETVKSINSIDNKSEQKQIENKRIKMAVKEYCEKNNIKDYNLNSFYIQVGRLSSKMSRELYRSVDYVKEGDYAVSKYDEDIIRHCVDIIKIENEKKNSLFNYYS